MHMAIMNSYGYIDYQTMKQVLVLLKTTLQLISYPFSRKRITAQCFSALLQVYYFLAYHTTN